MIALLPVPRSINKMRLGLHSYLLHSYLWYCTPIYCTPIYCTPIYCTPIHCTPIYGTYGARTIDVPLEIQIPTDGTYVHRTVPTCYDLREYGCTSYPRYSLCHDTPGSHQAALHRR